MIAIAANPTLEGSGTAANAAAKIAFKSDRRPRHRLVRPRSRSAQKQPVAFHVC